MSINAYSLYYFGNLNDVSNLIYKYGINYSRT